MYMVHIADGLDLQLLIWVSANSTSHSIANEVVKNICSLILGGLIFEYCITIVTVRNTQCIYSEFAAS